VPHLAVFGMVVDVTPGLFNFTTKISFMTSNEKVKRLPENPPPELLNAAYQHFETLLDYAPAAQWRERLEMLMVIAVDDELFTEQPEGECGTTLDSFFKLIRAFEDMEAAV